MATLTVKVCEECGKQASNTDGWLIMKSLDVRSARTKESVVYSSAEVDLCGPGCLLRFISRSLEPVMKARPEQPRCVEHRTEANSGIRAA